MSMSLSQFTKVSCFSHSCHTLLFEYWAIAMKPVIENLNINMQHFRKSRFPLPAQRAKDNVRDD